ncbi:MAG: histidine kinase [Acidobacteria bacterium]|nr:MAG: histidine kinase [Acidobacteriota bacterium]RLE20601.1 MAG: histidine kinase [Acidobacteriota bacterium]
MKTVRNILERKKNEVATVPVGTTIRQAVKVMADMGIGSVLVTDEKGLRGIFTERDVMKRVVAKNMDPDAVLVDDVMSTDIMTCSPDDTIEEVSRFITTARKRHIPVTEKGKLVGICTAGDIMVSVLEDRTIQVEHLKSYIQGDITH